MGSNPTISTDIQGAVKKVPKKKEATLDEKDRVLFFQKKAKKDGRPLPKTAKWWYNFSDMKNNTNGNNYTTIQLRILLDLEKK